jgi:hypothetical protein
MHGRHRIHRTLGIRSKRRALCQFVPMASYSFCDAINMVSAPLPGGGGGVVWDRPIPVSSTLFQIATAPLR